MRVGIITNNKDLVVKLAAHRFKDHDCFHLTDPAQLHGAPKDLSAMAVYSSPQNELPERLMAQVWVYAVSWPHFGEEERQLIEYLENDGWFINQYDDEPGAMNSIRHLAFTTQMLNPGIVDQWRTIREHLRHGCPSAVIQMSHFLTGFSAMAAAGFKSFDHLVKEIEEGVTQWHKKELEENAAREEHARQTSEEILNRLLNQVKGTTP